MIARKIKIRHNNTSVNNGRPIKVIGMNLAQCNSLNADFDGDETNIYVPQSYEAAAELWYNCSTAALIKSNQSSRLLSCICQDALTAGELATKGVEKYVEIEETDDEGNVAKKRVKKWFPFVPIDREDFYDALTTINQWNGEKDPNKILDRIVKKLDHIKEVYKWKNIDQSIFNGHALVSVLLPDDFEYKHEGTGVEVVRGVMIAGMLSKPSLGISPTSMVHKIEKEYGAEETIDFISNYQFIMNHYVKNRGFSIGIQDFIPKRVEEIKENIIKCFSTAQSIEDTEKDPDIREQKINFALNDATTIGKRISKESTNFDNSLNDMVKAGSKGSSINISQIMANVGQQNVEGKRIPLNCNGRSLPHYPKKFPNTEGLPASQVRKIIVKKYESGGFVSNSYINGLNPQECFFHAEGGREGIIDTGIKSVTGETTIVIMVEGKTKYVQIGEWIDKLLQNNKSEVEHHDEKEMELLNINNSMFIPTTDEKGNTSWGKITAVTRHDPTDNIYKIKTESGRNVTVAESKSLLIWNKDKKIFDQVFTPDVAIGDYVPVTMNLPKPPKILKYIEMSDYLPKNEFLYGTDFHNAVLYMEIDMLSRQKIPSGWWDKNNGTLFTLPYTSKARLQRVIVRSDITNIKREYIYPFSSARKEKAIPDKLQLTNENGIFIGLYLAEGNTDGHYVQITNIDKNIKNFVKTWFKKHNIICQETSKINKIGGLSESIRGTCTVLSKFLDKFCGHGAKNKFIADEIYGAPKSFLRGLLNGYFSGDGRVASNHITVGSSSYKLIEGISMLCSRFGIFGKMTKAIIKKNNVGTQIIQPSYRLTIRSKWAKIFQEEIDFIDTDKSKKIRIMTSSLQHINFPSVNDVVLDKIISIKKMDGNSHKKLYDLTIPSTLNFGLANGLQVVDTAHSGYIQRKLVKKMEDFIKAYNGLIVDSKGNVIQFNTKKGFDPARMILLEDDTSSFININNVVEKLNMDVEFDRYKENY